MGRTGFLRASQTDAGFRRFNQPFFVEAAHGALEGLLAHPQALADQFLPSLQGQFPAAGKFRQNPLSRLGDPLGAYSSQGNVDFPVLAHVLDKAPQTSAAVLAGAQFITIEQAVVELVDDDLGAKIGEFPDQQLNLVAVLEVAGPRFQALVETAGGDDAAAIIETDLDQILAPGLHALGLFGEGDEQLLGQPPVEKGADLRDLRHFEQGEFADLGQGRAQSIRVAAGSSRADSRISPAAVWK